MRYLNAARTLATYESCGGDQAFMGCCIDPVVEEILGFSSAITSKNLEEAVFVAAEDAPTVEWLLADLERTVTITRVLEAHGIAYRYPTGTPQATVPQLRPADSIHSISRVA